MDTSSFETDPPFSAEGFRLTLLVSVLSAFGVFVVALAYAGARSEAAWAGPLYWAGMATVVGPVLLAALSPALSRNQRLAVTVLLALALYAVKVFYEPLQFAFHDELQHWRTTMDIAATGRLFTPNPLLPISPSFPGLEIVAHALTAVTGLSLLLAGTILAGAAKTVLTAALFWLFERATQSARLAMVATLVYAANPHFTFFGSMYAYGTLALPLLVLSLVLLHRWSTWAGSPRAARYRLVTMLALAALAATHHLTSFVALGALLLWNLVSLPWNMATKFRLPPLQAAGFLLLAILVWHGVSGAESLSYLSAILGDAADALLGGRAADPPPLTRPVWEWLASAATVGLIALAIPVGAWRLRRHSHLDPLGVTLIIVAASYYLGLGARSLPNGAELAGRAWTFSYLGAALTVAAALSLTLMVPPSSPRRWLAAPLLGLLFLGGVVLGYPSHWGRLPGPYLVSAFERSVEAEGVQAAHWQARHLPPGERIATDFTNASLSGSYGNLEPVRGVHAVYFATTLGEEERRLLDRYAVSHLLVDLRMCRGVPRVGYYIVRDEPNAYRYDEPLDCDLLTKFEGAAGFARRYDGGSIRIYDVSGDGEDGDGGDGDGDG